MREEEEKKFHGPLGPFLLPSVPFPEMNADCVSFFPPFFFFLFFKAQWF